MVGVAHMGEEVLP
jgi:hypothetical protein